MKTRFVRRWQQMCAVLIITFMIVTFVSITLLLKKIMAPTRQKFLQVGNNQLSAVRRHIFMMETSGRDSLTPRQACAVESAARENINMDVKIYMTTHKINLTHGYKCQLTYMPNIHFEYLDLNQSFVGTPLESWYLDGKWRTSPYKTNHLSDALRLVVLFQKGGIYIDLDTIVLKSLDDLQNCSGLQNETLVASGVMAFERGHFFMKLCLEEFAKHYDATLWSYHGPELLTRVLKRVCGNITNLRDVNRSNCQGVTVLQPEAFYAIPYQQWNEFFDNVNTDKIIQKWNSSYLIHVWNKLSGNTAVIIGSNQPYEVAARRYCTSTYKLATTEGYF